MLYTEIPSLDLNSFINGSDSQKKEFVAQLGHAYHNIGFVAIKNHGLSNELTTNLYTQVKDFFALNDDEKRKYERPELHGQRGYISKGKEKAKGRKVGDLKEFYHVGQIKDSEEEIIQTYPDNVWPDEIPEFEKYCTLTFQNFRKYWSYYFASYCTLFGLR